MKNVLTSALLSATIIGTGLAVSSHVSAATLAAGASTDASVSFKAGDGTAVVPPVDPTDPTKPPVKPDPGETGNTGNLAIIYATKTVDFGADLAIPTTKMEYKSAKDLAIEVGDVRGTNAGWALSVQADQFKSGSDELTGAVLSTKSGKVVVAQATAGTTTAVSNAVGDLTAGGVALDAAKDTGSGVTVDTLAAGDISLTVPAGVAKAEAYSTKMNWTLSDVPA